jgi:t-SNARE complex subunit (syntaxin)
VLNDTAEEGWQVVTRALAQSRSYSETRMAYLEAQEYHAEIIQIEENIADLAELIRDVGLICSHCLHHYSHL